MTSLEFSTIISTDQKTLFEFHTDFNNVRIVTPSFISMRFTRPLQPLMKGTTFTVELNQFGRWIPWDIMVDTLIPYSLMIDCQSGRGPFKFWRHEHHFIEVENGVLLKDRIVYRLPFGIIGSIFDVIIFRFIQRVLFTYRHRRTKEYFSRV